MPITSPGNDDDTGENHQPTLRKNTAEPVEQTLKQNKLDTAAGKPAGILTFDQQLNRRYLELGATFVAVGADVTEYAAALDRLATSYGLRAAGPAQPAGY